MANPAQRIRTLRGKARTGASSVSWDRVIRGIGAFAVSLLLSRVVFFDSIAPVGPALVCAAFAWNVQPLTWLAGCLLGAITLVGQSMESIAISILAVGLSCLWLRKRQAAGGKRFLILLVAEMAIIQTALRMPMLHELLLALIETAAAAVLYLIFYRAFHIFSGKRRVGVLAEDEWICLSVVAGLLLLGLSPLYLAWFWPSGVIGIWLTLVFSRIAGIGVGACSGLAIGLVLSLGGQANILLLCSLGALGLLSGMLKRYGSWGCVLGAIVAGALMNLYANGSGFITLNFADLLLASVLFLLVPSDVLNKLGRNMDSRLHRGWREKYYLEIIRKSLEERMGAVSSLFQRMGQVLSKDTPKNGALAAQLEGVSKVMQTMGSQMDIQLRFERDLEGGLRELLNKYGFRVQEVTAYQSAYGMLTVRLAMGGCSTKSGCAARLVKVVSEACRVPMRIVGKQCPGQGAKSCKVVLEERAMLRADVGLVVRPCGGQVLCGDTVASVGWSSSHHMLCLSDGMGTGRDAHEHSEATVRLLIDMMEAGVGRDAAFKALNQFMQLKGPGEMFSTIDLCQINLLEARAEFVKVGAVPSYLLRDGSVQCLKSASLPIGIVDDVTYQRMDYGLRPRDVIVLMSDGIYDAIGEENMDRVLTGLETKMPAKRIADALIGLAIARRQTKEEDDMSVIVARIGKA